jgi:hypothetical protein
VIQLKELKDFRATMREL